MSITTILLLLFCLGIVACTIRVEPLGYKPPVRKVVVHKHHGKHRTAAEHGQVVVDSTWVNEYRQLQHEHGDYTIPDDSRIQYTKDGKVKVPTSVVKHFHDLSKTPKQIDSGKINEYDR